jgi:DNA-binding PadR family transcriptional regulator
MAEQSKGGATGDPALLIMTSLASGPKHGYALIQDIAQFADVRLGPGTLYGAISRLEERGLIEALAPDGRRRPYRLSVAGESSLEAALAEWSSIARIGLARLDATSAKPPSTRAGFA